MDRKLYTNSFLVAKKQEKPEILLNPKANSYIALPLIYFFSLSVGLIFVSCYLLMSGGPSKSFAKDELSDIQVELSKSTTTTFNVK